MKSIKQTRLLAWQDEFDQADDEIRVLMCGGECTHQAAPYRAGKAVLSGAGAAVDSADVLAYMPGMPMTRHAAHRLIERGISVDQVAMVMTFGQPQRVHGATRFALDKRARRLLAETVAPEYLRRFKSLDIVAVVSDEGALITAAHRTERLRRKVTHH